MYRLSKNKIQTFSLKFYPRRVNFNLQILTLLYYTPLGVVFLSFCPAILVATVWLGYHYLIDAIIGFSIGCVCSCIIIFIGKFVYTPRDVYIRIMMKYTREDGYNLIFFNVLISLVTGSNQFQLFFSIILDLFVNN